MKVRTQHFGHRDPDTNGSAHGDGCERIQLTRSRKAGWLMNATDVRVFEEMDDGSPRTMFKRGIDAPSERIN